jgi:hypothetical protein
MKAKKLLVVVLGVFVVLILSLTMMAQITTQSTNRTVTQAPSQNERTPTATKPGPAYEEPVHTTQTADIVMTPIDSTVKPTDTTTTITLPADQVKPNTTTILTTTPELKEAKKGSTTVNKPTPKE